MRRPQARPLTWVLAAAFAALVIASFVWGGRGGSFGRPTTTGATSTGTGTGTGSTGGTASKAGTTRNVDLSALIARVRKHPGTIRRVVFDPKTQAIAATLGNGAELDANYPSSQSQIDFQQLLQRKGVDFTSKPAPPPAGSGGGSGGWIAATLSWLLPILLIGVVWWLVMRRARRQGNQILGFGRSRAKRITPSMPQTTYADVAGAAEAIEELCEIRDFLSAPRRFRALGARIPKGVLLHGPPGTGKTLLARATAGEAGVPFFSISGSDFVEMFVGVGASRVRDLFEQAKNEAPAIVFIDELDAVGRHRGAGLGGGNDEREQTLNQLLVAMDGFEDSQNVVVIGATNRPDVLDPALLRPGRFDRQILVDRADRAGRRQILGIHARGKPLADDVDLDRLAAATPGFTGADLANLLNEAALLAGRRGKQLVGQAELDEATLRVVAGPEKRSRVLSERERTVAAYHEVGHALVGELLEKAEKPQKISIIGRGQALGFTLSLPAEDKMLAVRSELMDGLAMALGGRAAEELVFDEVSTGAMNDLEKVTSTATAMVTRYGMSALGPRVVAPAEQQPFLGRQLQPGGEHSEELTRMIDREVRRIIDEAHETARRVLDAHLEALHRISAVLIEKETIDRPGFKSLLADERAPAADAPVARDPAARDGAARDGAARDGAARNDGTPALAGEDVAEELA